MPKSGLGQIESDRLQELYSYNILDSEIDNDFEELVDFATQISGCPIAAITFVDKDRQWFKAKKGDSIKQTSRDISFCAHTILADTPMVVEDASRDERFRQNPDVTGGLNIRFYAGVPIYSRRRFRIGTVCVIDSKPRKKDDKLIAALSLISKEVSNLLELHTHSKMLEAYSRETLQNSVNSQQLFFEQAAVPCWIYDMEMLRFLQVNEAAIKKYGYSRKEFLTMTVHDIRDEAEKLKIHQLVQGSHGGTITFPSVHCTKSKETLYVEVTIRDVVYLGKAARMATINDVTEKERFKKMVEDQKKILGEMVRSAAIDAKAQERDFIGKELHDNINQILASTKLFLEIASNNEEARENMIELCKRNVLEAMKEIRVLSHSLVLNNKQRFSLTEAIKQSIFQFSIAHDIQLHFNTEGPVDDLPEDLQLTLFRIVQEGFNNISKYAQATEAWILLEASDLVTMTIKDNGIGFDPVKTPRGIGLSNMKQRADFYNGHIEIKAAPKKGCTLKISMPAQYQKMAG